MDRFDRQIVEQIPGLRRYARALTGDSVQSADLVQECLARALSRRRLWLRDKSIRPWLFTIMHNLYVNEVRQGARAAALAREARNADMHQASMPEDAALTMRDLDLALARLSEEHRAVVVLVGLEQLSYKEAARVLGLPAGTLMSRLARARERLRSLLWEDAEPSLRRIK